ncbi:hypothetical protein BHO_0900078 (plasmid) [Borrelia hermsii YBT]|uniref:Uncharacterized protein n=1 Tax=Borrelia hermsii YBT TaxID=1313295 RepID=W5T2S5_BORHE|nr:hypothetical protein BHO_0900078 [Borrelia hermsii YBT]
MQNIYALILNEKKEFINNVALFNNKIINIIT